MEFLPIEVHFQIFNWLDAITLLNLRKVNGALKSAVECYNEHYDIWEKFCKSDIADQRVIKNLITAIDNHSNGLISRFRDTWDSVYELWMNFNNFKSFKFHFSCINKIVKRIYQVMCHENFIFCVHAREILIFDKSGDLLHIHRMKKDHRLVTKCFDMLLISFKSENELNSLRTSSSIRRANVMELEVINTIKCCTLAFCSVLYKNSGGLDDIIEKITYLSYKSPKLRRLMNICGLEKILNDFNILDVEVTADENVLIVHKSGQISLIDHSDNNNIKRVNNYLYVKIYGSEFLKGSNGNGWFYVKCHFFKISSLLLYINLLILGSEDGFVYVYYAEQVLNLKFGEYAWRKKISNDSIQHLCISLVDSNFVILAATSYRIYQIYFKLN